jgi:hypothetical protein
MSVSKKQCPNHAVLVRHHHDGNKIPIRIQENNKMKYLLMLYSEEGGWQNLTEAQQQQGLSAYMGYTEALREAGALVGASRLQPVSTATTVRLVDGKSQVLDGPYADSKEQLGGYYLIEAPDVDSAIAWAARCPGASHGTIEVRPLWES